MNIKRPSAKAVAFGIGSFCVLGLSSLVLLYGLSVQHEVREKEERAETKTSEAKAAKAAELKTCRTELHDYVLALVDISAQLGAAGLTQDELGNLTGIAASEQARVDTTKLSPGCLDLMHKADTALGVYGDTAMEWNECIWEQDYCDPDFSEQWATARFAAEQAKEALATGSFAEVDDVVWERRRA